MVHALGTPMGHPVGRFIGHPTGHGAHINDISRGSFQRQSDVQWDVPLDDIPVGRPIGRPIG